MQVADKLPLGDYHADPRFAAKIPRHGAARCVEAVGDNIYGVRDGVFFQVPNRHHSAKDLAKDTSGKFVLIARTFAYFGSDPLVIPDKLRPDLAGGQSADGTRTDDVVRVRAFIDYVLAKGTGVHAPPTSWKAGDASWKRRRSTCG